jgi:hypothetical protein
MTKKEIQDCQNLEELAAAHNEIDSLLEEGKISLNEHIELIAQVMITYHELEQDSYCDIDASWEG